MTEKPDRVGGAVFPRRSVGPGATLTRHIARFRPGMNEFEIDPVEVKKKMDRGDQFFLLDVREPHEVDICQIPGSYLIPLGQVPARVSELNSADDMVVYCRSGQRSGKAVDFLRKAGFRKIKNMRGGILAWSDKVDPSVPKY